MSQERIQDEVLDLILKKREPGFEISYAWTNYIARIVSEYIVANFETDQADLIARLRLENEELREKINENPI